MQLSSNFSLHEFMVSQTAERKGIDMTPDDLIISNLTTLCQDVLQPIRDAAGMPISISSGYRPIALNVAIGGSKTSAHMYGRAADFQIHGMGPFTACNLIASLDIEFDQLIHEFGRWIHIGIATTNRHQLLTAYKAKGKTKYVEGIHQMEELA